jgi:AcrR family transcriptional regulator
MRRRLFDTAITLFGERGYEGATLREVAARADTSPALLYRYFANKRAVVLALYDQLSEALAERAEALPKGRWRDRFFWSLELSLEILGPHRLTLRALAPVLVGDDEEGVFARHTAFSRARVQAVFEESIAGATDAPRGATVAPALGRLLYVGHLGVILWWLLDRSPQQRATAALVVLIRRTLAPAAMLLHLRWVRDFVLTADRLYRSGLLGEDGV